ncbi:MAG: putative toxin-antitoxin system toxin component, PIN family [Candidatus Micrarchaeaceae archaeon]
MIKIVVDTNIFISAILFDGIPGKIIELGLEGKIQILISQEILEELTNVLQNKFNFQIDMVKSINSFIKEFVVIIYPGKKIKVIQNKESDNRVLECAIEGKVDYIITGDIKHIQILKEYRGIKILNPSQFLEKFMIKQKRGDIYGKNFDKGCG